MDFAHSVLFEGLFLEPSVLLIVVFEEFFDVVWENVSITENADDILSVMAVLDLHLGIAGNVDIRPVVTLFLEVV